MMNSLRQLVRVALPLALAFSLIAPVAAQSGKCLAGVDYISRAESSLQEGQYASAIDAFTCIIESDPASLDARLGRATATLLQAAVRGDVDFNVTPDLNLIYEESYDTLTQAIANASEALTDDPQNVEALAVRGYLYWYLGQNQNALADFDTILRQDDGNVYAYLFRGAANLYLGNQAKAQTDFDNALEIAAEPAGAYAQVGAMYGNTAYPDLALENYDTAIELDPDNATFYGYRAYTHDQLGNIDAAIDDYTSAIALDPANEGYYLSRAWEYEQLSEYEDAVADYTSALEINPNNAETYQYRGWASISLEDFESASADFEAALALDDTNRWVFLGQGTALAALGQPVASAEAFAQYISLMQSFQSDGETMKPGNSQTFELTEGQVYAVPLNAEAGTQLVIQATSPIGEVDPMMILLGTDNRPLAGSDDIEDGNLNASISLEVPTSGRYTLVVTHAGGGSYGFVDVTVTDAGSRTAPQPTEVASNDACSRLDGLAALEAEDYLAAVEAFACAYEATPDDAQLLLESGLAGLMAGPNADALNAIDEADTLEVGLIEAQVDDLSALLQSNPQNVYALTARAYLHWYRALDDLALEDYAALLEIDPENPFALLYRGSSNQYLGNSAAAAADFERVSDVYSDNAEALGVIAYSYVDTADDANALRYLNMALEAEPENVSLLVARARAQGRLGNVEDAIVDMDTVLALEPDNATHSESLGWILLRAGRYDEAVTAFESALVIDPGMIYSVLGRATANTSRGNVAEGAENYAAYIDMIELESSQLDLVDGIAPLLMGEGVVYRVPVTLQAGQTIDIVAESLDGNVDTLLLVTDGNGVPLIGNDDTDEANGDFDASIRFTAPEAGDYEIVVTHSGSGSTGGVDLIVTGLEGPVPTPTRTK